MKVPLHELSPPWTPKELQAATATQLGGGFSKDTLYRVDIGKKPFVLRMFGEKRSQTECKQMIDAHVWASDHGFGPKVRFIDKNSRYFLMDFASGNQLRFKDFKKPKMIKLLGETLAKIHLSPPPANPKEGSHFTIGQQW